MLYARLLRAAPQQLADHLVRQSAAWGGRSTDAALQSARYHSLLLGVECIVGLPRLAVAIESALASHVSHPSRLVRDRVAAELSEKRPALVAAACAPVFEGFASRTASDARSLLDLYLASLGRCLEQTADRSGRARGLPDDVLPVFSFAFARDDTVTRAKLIRFLEERDVDLLLSSLCDVVEPAVRKASEWKLRDLVQLGDSLAANGARAAASVRERAVGSLISALESSDDAIALFASRYLVESGVASARDALEAYRDSARGAWLRAVETMSASAEELRRDV